MSQEKSCCEAPGTDRHGSYVGDLAHKEVVGELLVPEG
jgi:hypothetical protein